MKKESEGTFSLLPAWRKKGEKGGEERR